MLNDPSRALTVEPVPIDDTRTPGLSSTRPEYSRPLSGSSTAWLGGDDLPALARVGLEQRRGPHHLHRFRHLAGLQPQVHALPGADRRLEVVGERDREALQFRGDLVAADAHGHELEVAVRVRHVDDGDPGVEVRQRDGGARDDAARCCHGRCRRWWRCRTARRRAPRSAGGDRDTPGLWQGPSWFSPKVEAYTRGDAVRTGAMPGTVCERAGTASHRYCSIADDGCQANCR